MGFIKHIWLAIFYSTTIRVLVLVAALEQRGARDPHARTGKLRRDVALAQPFQHRDHAHLLRREIGAESGDVSSGTGGPPSTLGEAGNAVICVGQANSQEAPVRVFPSTLQS